MRGFFIFHQQFLYTLWDLSSFIPSCIYSLPVSLLQAFAWARDWLAIVLYPDCSPQILIKKGGPYGGTACQNYGTSVLLCYVELQRVSPSLLLDIDQVHTGSSIQVTWYIPFCFFISIHYISQLLCQLISGRCNLINKKSRRVTPALRYCSCYYFLVGTPGLPFWYPGPVLVASIGSPEL